MKSAPPMVSCLAAALGAASALIAQPDLAYVESSNGLTPPQWEKGRTTLALADLNLDGHVDTVSIGDHGSPNINSQIHGFSIWFGDGAGNWTSFQTGAFGYGGVAVGDLNWDGKPDLAYGMHHNYSGTDLGDQILEAALGDGTGTNWTPWDDGLATNGEDYGMFGVALADFDADGDLDLVANSFGCCAGVHVYANQHYWGPSGTWLQTFGFVGGNSTQDAAAGDVNNDGYTDFVVAHQNGTVYVNNGDAPFTVSDAGLPAGGLVGRRSPHLADVNADARDDLAFVNSGGGVEVWLRSAAGAWTSASTGLPTSAHAAVRLRDMDGDGTTDLVAYRPTLITVWRGDGGTSWAQVASIATPAAGDYSGMVLGDVDHSGLSDIVLVAAEGTGLNPRNRLRVFKESAVPSALSIHITAPSANQHIQHGAATFIEWDAAVPGGTSATVTLERAFAPGGPWSLIGQSLPNGGCHQFQFPRPSNGTFCSYPSTTALYVRATVQTAAGFAADVAGPMTLHAGCYADCNQSGTLTIADFGCFQAAFATEWCDCNCSGTCTIADYSCFQAAFVQGCP